MQIILSRKGFDSQYGGQPSPIMPDGTLLSLPIPAKEETLKFSDLTYNEKTYLEIIKELKPNAKIKDKFTCHLDPDIRKDTIKRLNGWKPLFGQHDHSQSHLENEGVKEGDLFLFFGWYRNTELKNGKLKYIGRDLHVIYGYLQIGKRYKDMSSLPLSFQYHPHACNVNFKNNCIYKASDKLSFFPELDGAGCLKYNKDLVLTKDGLSRTKWDLPDFFRNIEITHHSKESWSDNYFQSAPIGQEFVIEENENVSNWAKQLITKYHI